MLIRNRWIGQYVEDSAYGWQQVLFYLFIWIQGMYVFVDANPSQVQNRFYSSMWKPTLPHL